MNPFNDYLTYETRRQFFAAAGFSLGTAALATLDAKAADVAKLDDGLGFKGRVVREELVKQAKALAKGGEAEYIRVFGKKPR